MSLPPFVAGAARHGAGEIRDTIAGRRRISISPQALARSQAGFDRLREAAALRPIYGVNTGFGPMVSHAIETGDYVRLQYNLIRSHALGAGEPLEDVLVRATLLARLSTLAQGYSAVPSEVLQLLAGMLNEDILPIIPEHGGVGASGDLVQLAHVALAMIGEGEVRHRGRRVPAAGALRDAGLSPMAPRLREGLALMNGTACMTGIALVNAFDARRLLAASVLASSLLQEVCEASPEPFSEAISAVRRHRGQRDVAAAMRRYLEGSNMISHGTDEVAHRVQLPYSLRCVPQVLGPVHATIEGALSTAMDEFSSCSDNPICLPDTGEVIHGGNFHGDVMALEMDHLKIAVAKATLLADRKLNYLLHDGINRRFPPFLNLGRLGLNLGLQGAQFTATSTAAESQSLAYPASLHSIPCNRDNQDIVSMGTNAALMARRVLGNAWQVLTIEFLALSQAVASLDCLERLAAPTRDILAAIRVASPPFTEDVLTASAIAAAEQALREVAPLTIGPAGEWS